MKETFFFANKYWLESHNLSQSGFDLLGTEHIVWLVIVMSFILFFSRYYDRQSEYKQNNTRKMVSVVLLVLEIVRDIVLIIYDAPMIHYLPFTLTGLAIFAVLIDAFFRKQNLTGNILAYAFMPASLFAMVFCPWNNYPVVSFMTIYYFAFNALVLAYFFMQYYNSEVIPTYKGVWYTFITMLVISLPVGLLDKTHGLNYMFLTKPEAGTPFGYLWDFAKTDFVYLLLYAILALLLFHLLYLFYNFSIKVMVRNKNRSTRRSNSGKNYKKKKKR